VGFLEQIKEIPIVDYADRLGFTLVRKGKYFSIKEHDSVMIDTIKNCFWRNSNGASGSIIDFAIEFKNYSGAKEAMGAIAFMYGINDGKPATVKYNSIPKIEQKSTADKSENEKNNSLMLPEKAKNNRKVYRYLYKERCIESIVIRHMAAKKMFYQDVKGNCVFVSNGFACVRSTVGNFSGDVSGSDYRECVYIKYKVKADTLIVNESVIDSMSLMSYFVKTGKRYDDYWYLSLCGVNKLASLYYHTQNDTNIKKIILALDNDEAGLKATDTAFSELKNMGFDENNIVIMLPTKGKDWNDTIKEMKKEETKIG